MLDAISAALSEMLKDESNFARAEALYAESFRAGAPFTVATGPCSRSELLQYLMLPINKAVEPRSFETSEFIDDDLDEDDEDDYDFEPEILKPGLSLEQAELLVDSLEFVELCNYKGEGEGYELACRVTHLRQYVGKYEYLAA